MHGNGTRSSVPARLVCLNFLCAVLITACTTLDTSPIAGRLDTAGLASDTPDLELAASSNSLQNGAQLMASGQYELAINAFNKVAVEEGISPDVLVALGGANLGLGRLGQAEELFRRAVDLDDTWPEPWNNLGVVMMERNQPARAVQMFRRAYALDGGDSNVIRANLQLAETRLNEILPKQIEDNSAIIRRAPGDVLIRTTGKQPAQTAWNLAQNTRTTLDRPALPGLDTAPSLDAQASSDLSLPLLTSGRLPSLDTSN